MQKKFILIFAISFLTAYASGSEEDALLSDASEDSGETCGVVFEEDPKHATLRKLLQWQCRNPFSNIVYRPFNRPNQVVNRFNMAMDALYDESRNNVQLLLDDTLYVCTNVPRAKAER